MPIVHGLAGELLTASDIREITSHNLFGWNFLCRLLLSAPSLVEGDQRTEEPNPCSSSTACRSAVFQGMLVYEG